jgi:hypothetical protein
LNVSPTPPLSCPAGVGALAQQTAQLLLAAAATIVNIFRNMPVPCLVLLGE